MKDSMFRNIMHIALGSSCKSSNLYASFRDNSVQEITILELEETHINMQGNMVLNKLARISAIYYP